MAVILGLAVATTDHHAAALVVDGQLVAAAEEERFSRRKHHGVMGAPFADSNLISDPRVRLRAVICRRAVDFVLERAGLTQADVDIVAVNGIPYAHRSTYHPTKSGAHPRILSEGRTFYVPHHLAHAASAQRMAAHEGGIVLTVDGRGERETAAAFVSEGGELRRLWDLPVRGRDSVGGCFETASRVLGFGPFGQGALMALAALGRPNLDLSRVFRFGGVDDYCFDAAGLGAALEPVRRAADEPIKPEHIGAAAAVQHALSRALVAMVEAAREAAGGDRALPVSLAGGVALNCPSNSAILQAADWPSHFIQPAAHDAGTALGAALEVAHHLGEPAPAPMSRADWGPEYAADACREALEASGLQIHEPAEPHVDVARRLAKGEVVCRLTGRMEFGPRALGHRSILASPSHPGMKARLNAMKSRAEWRPFGPAVLQDSAREWVGASAPSPFMLLTSEVPADKRSAIPVAVHADGSTRPQTVCPRERPSFAALLEAFEAETGVPMLINTSFNTGGEPIVCSPKDAVRSFARLGADALYMGPFVATRSDGSSGDFPAGQCTGST